MLIQINKNEEKIILKLRELPEEKRMEVVDFIDFLRNSSKVTKSEKEADEFGYYLEMLRKKIVERGGFGLGKTKEEILEKLRKTREEVWKDNYEDYFGHQ